MDASETTDYGEDADHLSLLEQPGGRVGFVNGKPFCATDIEAESRDAYAGLQARFAWLGPLLEAAIINGATSPGDNRARFITAYGNDTTGEYEDAEKHCAYIGHVEQEVSRHQPWLFPMFHAARAGIVVAPQGFCFSLPTRLGAQWDVPDLAEAIALTPFVEDGEIAH